MSGPLQPPATCSSTARKRKNPWITVIVSPLEKEKPEPWNRVIKSPATPTTNSTSWQMNLPKGSKPSGGVIRLPPITSTSGDEGGGIYARVVNSPCCQKLDCPSLDEEQVVFEMCWTINWLDNNFSSPQVSFLENYRKFFVRQKKARMVQWRGSQTGGSLTLSLTRREGNIKHKWVKFATATGNIKSRIQMLQVPPERKKSIFYDIPG